jgi:hypothetical protein
MGGNKNKQKVEEEFKLTKVRQTPSSFIFRIQRSDVNEVMASNLSLIISYEFLGFISSILASDSDKFVNLTQTIPTTEGRQEGQEARGTNSLFHVSVLERERYESIIRSF